MQWGQFYATTRHTVPLALRGLLKGTNLCAWLWDKIIPLVLQIHRDNFMQAYFLPILRHLRHIKKGQ